MGGLTGSCVDHIGRKNVLIGGIAVALIGSIIIAAAQNMAAVLVGSAMQAGHKATSSLSWQRFFLVVSAVLVKP